MLTDLVHNIGRPAHTWTRLYSQTMGFYDKVAQSRVLRGTSFDDRGAARASVDALLDQNFDRLVVGHGMPVESAAREVLSAATARLPAAPLRLTAGVKPARFSPKPCG